MLESLLTISPEQLVIDNEILAMAARAVRGIEIDEDTLAFDVIREAGPQGNYLAAEHTTRYLRTEFLEPMLADRSDRETWERLGMAGINDKARAVARDLLADAPPTVLPDAIDRRIRDALPIRLPAPA
jgi:trimethylamine--corrinoid protein Co-methyltransferase